MNENRIRSVFTDPDIGFPDSFRSFRFPEAAERPEARNGTTFYNTGTKVLETCIEGNWVPVAVWLAPSMATTVAAAPALLEGSNVKLEPLPDGSTRIHVPEVGDYTTAENVGQGQGLIYRGKSGTNLNLRRLASANEHLLIETEADTITFTAKSPGESNTGRNQGPGTPVYMAKDGTELVFRSLIGLNGISVSPTPDGMIAIQLVANEQIGLNLPKTTAPISDAGVIRYNPGSDSFEGVLKSGTVQFSTSTGTFLSLSGGTLNGPFSAPTIAVSDIHVSNRLTATEINLEGSKLVSGLTGTIDGFRFPEIAAAFTEINQTAPGLLVRTSSGYTSKTLRGVPNQIAILDDLAFGIANNPVVPGTDSMVVPVGSAQTRTDRLGGLRYDQAGRFEVCYPTGWEQIITSQHGTLSGLRVLGDAFISGSLNGRNIENTFRLIDQISTVRGVPYNGPDGVSTFAIKSDDGRPGIHVSDQGGIVLIGLDAAAVAAPILAQIDQSVVRSDSMVAGRTIDGRNLVRDGAVIDALTGLVPGVLVSAGNGQFTTRAVVGSALPGSVGISVSNSTGTGDIRIGLTLSELPEITTVADTDWIIVAGTNGNAKISVANLRAALGVK